MNQLDTLARLSDLRLLRDLTTLASHRYKVSHIESAAQTLRAAIAAETEEVASLQGHDQAAARLFAVYAQNAQTQLKTLAEAKAEAKAATETALQAALRAQGRVRAIATLQKRALAERRALTASREEAVSMGRLATLSAAAKRSTEVGVSRNPAEMRDDR